MRKTLSPYTTIWWDAGGVLFADAHLWYRDTYIPVLVLLGISKEQAEAIFIENKLNRLWLGTITEDKYWQTYLAHSPLKPSLSHLKKLYRICITVNEELLQVIERLSKTYDQYLVSNHSREWLGYLVKRYHLQKYFKDIFCSAELGVKKPDPRFFQIVLEKTGKKPHEILYIDDRHRNISAAQALGVKSILVK